MNYKRGHDSPNSIWFAGLFPNEIGIFWSVQSNTKDEVSLTFILLKSIVDLAEIICVYTKI